MHSNILSHKVHIWKQGVFSKASQDSQLDGFPATAHAFGPIGGYLCFVFQLPVGAARSSATATCASTLLWCATAFRTVSFPGMKATAKVHQLCLQHFVIPPLKI